MTLASHYDHAAAGSISGADAVLARVFERQRALRAKQGREATQRAQARAREVQAWEAVRERRRTAQARREEARCEEWARKAAQEVEIEQQMKAHAASTQLRRRRAELGMRVELMRREAQHHAHQVRLQGVSAQDQSKGGVDRAGQWLALSEIPSYRLVSFVYECIDADRSGTLEHAEILASPFGKKLAPHWAELDSNGDGSVTPGEWSQFFDKLRDTLGPDFGMFMVDLLWQANVDTTGIMSPTQAASVIQAHFRGRQMRRALASMAARVTRLQCAYRSLAARRLRSKKVAERAARRIQSRLRARRARRKLQQTRPGAATALNDHWGQLTAPGEALNAFRQANRMLEQGNWGQTLVSAYMLAIELGHPRRGRCFNGAGMGLCQIGKFNEGIAMFTRALEEDKYDSRTYHNRAKAAAAIGDLRMAHADAWQARCLARDHQIDEQTKRRARVNKLKRAASAAAGLQKGADGADGTQPTPWSSPEMLLWYLAGETPEPTTSLAMIHGETRCDTLAVSSLSARMFRCALRVMARAVLCRADKKQRESAAKRADKELVAMRRLIAAGADPDFTDQGQTCLTRAATVGNLVAVDQLMHAGADLERPDASGMSPLMLAAQHGQVWRLSNVPVSLTEGALHVSASRLYSLTLRVRHCGAQHSWL
jgi:tetratricopeptide (TPR) repeat protein